MKSVTYSREALKALAKHSNVARRVLAAFAAYAVDPHAHANNVTKLVGTETKRMRVGDFRAIFIETEQAITVVKIAPRGEIYD